MRKCALRLGMPRLMRRWPFAALNSGKDFCDRSAGILPNGGGRRPTPGGGATVRLLPFFDEEGHSSRMPVSRRQLSAEYPRSYALRSGRLPRTETEEDKSHFRA